MNNMLNENNVNIQLMFLTREWNELYTHSNSVHPVVNNILSTLNGLGRRSNSNYCVSRSEIKVGNYSLSIHSHIHYSNALAMINLLIKAVASNNRNDFGLFISKWNRAMYLESNHKDVSHFAKSYTDLNNQLKSQATQLINAGFVTMPEMTVLNHIIKNTWNVFARESIMYEELKHSSISAVIKAHASQIVHYSIDNSAILNYLKLINVFSGDKLQEKLELMVDHDHGDVFKFVLDKSTAISQITNPNALYYYNKNIPFNIHSINSNDLIKLVNKHESIKKKYNSLINSRHNLDTTITNMKHKYNL